MCDPVMLLHIKHLNANCATFLLNFVIVFPQSFLQQTAEPELLQSFEIA